jgi:hypothetical protein
MEQAPRKSRVGERIASGIALSLLAATTVLSIVRLNPPTNAYEFPIDRALQHLRVIAREPHAYGSPADRAVREYIEGELTSFGLEVQTQSDKVRIGRSGVVVQPINVIAQVHGTNREPTTGRHALMLACHYDSARLAPGAADDGAAAAALLEVARIMASHPPPRNDVIFIFSDAEEVSGGMPGAVAFVEHHPWAKEVAVVLNFEARGTTGPSIMFETSAGNAWLVSQYAHAAPHPVTTSLAYDAYKRMPNDTDFTVYKASGMAGLNFAFIGSYRRYHTPEDSVENLSRASLIHHSLTALWLGESLANSDLSSAARGGDAVYFDVLGWFVVHYGIAWAMPIAVILTVVVALVLVEAWRRRVVRLWRVLAAIGVFVLSLAIAIGAAIAILTAVGVQRADAWPLWFGGGMAVTGIACTAGLRWAARRWITTPEQAIAGLLVWAIIGLLVASEVPGGSYLVALPTLLGVVAWWTWRELPLNWSTMIGAVLGSAVIAIWAPALLLFGEALTMRNAPVVAVLACLVGWVLPSPRPRTCVRGSDQMQPPLQDDVVTSIVTL